MFQTPEWSSASGSIPGRRFAVSRALAAVLFPALPLILAPGFQACQPGSGDRVWGGTESDSAGIRLVHNPSEGLWGPGEAWTLKEDLLIGADDRDPAYQFGGISSVDVSSDGHIFVFDQMAREIRVFDSTGTHTRTLGGGGEGPGEFSGSATDVFLTRDHRMVVPDMGNGRIGWMSLEGHLLTSVPVSFAGGFPVRWGSDGGGSVVVQRRAMGFNQDPKLEAGDPLVRIDPDGRETTLVLMPRAETVWMEGAAARFRYFATEPSWALGPSGVLRTGMTKHYRIALRDADGALQTVFTKPYPQRPVTGEDRTRFEELLRAALDRAGVAPDAIQRQIDALTYDETFPAFNRIMEGPGGTTIVQQVADLSALEDLDLAEEMSRRMGSRTWDVFGSDQRYLGTIELPPRFTPMVWRHDAVYGRWLDGVDRHHLMRLRLDGNVASEPSEPEVDSQGQPGSS